MKRVLVLSAAVASSVVSAPVSAADLPPHHRAYTVAQPYGQYSWIGPYIGANLGYQFGDATSTGLDPHGVTGGIQGGYNWQTGPWVFGVEADIQGSGADDTFAAFKFSNPWFGTLRGRIGYAFNNILLYGAGGLAIGGGDMELLGVSETNTHVGWALGLGLEVGITPNWSAKAEYLYVDLDKESYFLTGTRVGIESSVLRFGVNYRF